jgi:hypothetical protein
MCACQGGASVSRLFLSGIVFTPTLQNRRE